MHPIDRAIDEMQARRRARTWPPVTLDEFAELNRDELVAMAKGRGINAAQNRRAMILALYRAIHELDKLQGDDHEGTETGLENK